MSITRTVLAAVVLLSSGCEFDRQLGESYDESRAEELRLACEEEYSPAPPPELAGSFTEPSDIAPCTPIAALTEAERVAWCDWYTVWFQNMDGLPPPEGVIENGHVQGGVQNHSSMDGHHYCIQDVAVEHCQANLAISDCQAPLVTIERCVRSMFEQHDHLQDACADLLDLDTCATTIVQREETTTACPVPIE